MKSLTPSSLGAGAASNEDVALVRRCRDGDQDAWDELVERYQRLVFAIPRRAGLSDDEATDIFQEVFLTLLEKIDELEQPGRIRAWMVTTAKFKTWSAVRRRRGVFSPATDEEMELEMASIADPNPIADEVLIELEEQHVIRRALATLEERCRRILSMLYLMEPAASYARVAREVGVGETSISPLRARCLKKLRQVLTKE